jgi:hypothetical protein
MEGRVYGGGGAGGVGRVYDGVGGCSGMSGWVGIGDAIVRGFGPTASRLVGLGAI